MRNAAFEETVARDDARVDGLTTEQAVAAGTAKLGIFIEAGPGTGKTTVAAHRFVALRYRSAARHDDRAVVAVSFTRAATGNLKRRVRRFAGPSSTAWPHRIVTLDTVMSDLLHHLLLTGDVTWPGGHTTLKVEDSWQVLGETFWTKQTYEMILQDGQVGARRVFADVRAARPDLHALGAKLNAGTCTHADVRALVELSLAEPTLRSRLQERLARSVRSLIVDEVFDANSLDVAVLALAADAGVDLTLVGDPWQALYSFRGARPAEVAELITSRELETLPLTESFRWRSLEQAQLALALRAGEGVQLEQVDAAALGAENVDVVLATEWKTLWELGDSVLPLAFHSFKGTAEEAAATLVLNHVTRSLFALDAVYVGDALTLLAIDDDDIVRRLEPELAGVLSLLAAPGRAGETAAWTRLVAVLQEVSPRFVKKAHKAHTTRLAITAARLHRGARPVPGLTAHQAKGREWDTVGIGLTASQAAMLAAGLDPAEDTARKLYVAATRARRRTLLVQP